MSSLVEEESPPISVKLMVYRSNQYIIKGLPSSHKPWITLKWMPGYKRYRVTYSPPFDGYVTAKFISLKAKCHTTYDRATLEEVVEVLKGLSSKPLFFT